jgi:hypothetical protein
LCSSKGWLLSWCYSEVSESSSSSGGHLDTEWQEAGITPLHFACRIGNAEYVQVLIAKGENVNQRTAENLLAPLHGTRRQRIGVGLLWADHGVAVACLFGQPRCVELLLKSGADPLARCAVAQAGERREADTLRCTAIRIDARRCMRR